KPCFFMAVTTIAGFASLVLSGILPVIHFGWMMSVGIAISLVLVFLIFPTVLVQLPKIAPNTSFENFFGLTRALAKTTEKFGKSILVVSGIVLALCVAGALQLMVENSFIDYFKKSTEIYQGMKVIDQQLGGTTPFDVVLNFKPEQEPEPQGVPAGNPGEEEEDDEFDEFVKEFVASLGEAQYWFTSEKMEEVEKIHDYLENLQIGKVLSLATMLKVGKTHNDGDPLDNFALALLYNELPERYRKIVLNPYVSVENNQVRYSIRVRDSEPDLRRNELLKKINRELKSKMGLEEDRFQVAGLLVLYNNMLQSLFKSQIQTLGVVILVLMFMFLILFRSLKISIIAILPNIVPVGVVLGLMGWAKIPLDLMTITIAAISIGIAVDDTIHYIHRFKEEFPKDRNYLATMHRCHRSIGYAMYYTSVTIVIGFSILVLSNFIPSIYFGLLTGLAMISALLTDLTLLPRLIIFFKPLGPEGSVESA
ncbi:MAG: MMPL family transporter, partial [bacterium]